MVRAVGSGSDLGTNQSTTNSNARSDVPTQATYRPIGITVSRPHTRVTRANAIIADSSLLQREASRATSNVVTNAVDAEYR
jgi:hypothetical protein